LEPVNGLVDVSPLPIPPVTPSVRGEVAVMGVYPDPVVEPVEAL
jgi:hypothetical protein